MIVSLSCKKQSKSAARFETVYLCWVRQEIGRKDERVASYDVRREAPGSGRRDGQQPVNFFEQRILFIGESEESIYPFLPEVRHEVFGAISG